MAKKFCIMSGKGGVGKTSISLMTAQILSEKGKTLLVDYDLCGPSVTTAFNLKGKIIKNEKGFIPIKATESLDILSFGSILEPKDVLIWRGPKKIVFLDLFAQSFEDYDYVVIDTPPGISEEHEYLSEKEVSVVVVTTPQNIALNDAQRCIEFCQSRNMNILGVIENMSYYKCQCCSEMYFPFGSGGGSQLAAEYEIKFLGQLEIDQNLCNSIDSGSLNQNYRDLSSYLKLSNILSSFV